MAPLHVRWSYGLRAHCDRNVVNDVNEVDEPGTHAHADAGPVLLVIDDDDDVRLALRLFLEGEAIASTKRPMARRRSRACVLGCGRTSSCSTS